MSDYDKMIAGYRKREDWGYTIFLGLMVAGVIAITVGLMMTGSCVDSAVSEFIQIIKNTVVR